MKFLAAAGFGVVLWRAIPISMALITFGVTLRGAWSYTAGAGGFLMAKNGLLTLSACFLTSSDCLLTTSVCFPTSSAYLLTTSACFPTSSAWLLTSSACLLTSSGYCLTSSAYRLTTSAYRLTLSASRLTSWENGSAARARPPPLPANAPTISPRLLRPGDRVRRITFTGGLCAHVSQDRK